MTNDENEIPLNTRRSIRDIPIPRRRDAAAAPRSTGDVRPVKAPRRQPEPVAEEPIDEILAEEETLPIRNTQEPMSENYREEESAPEPSHRAYRSERRRSRRGSLVKIGLTVVAVGACAWLFTWHSADISLAERHAAKEINLTLPVSIGEEKAGALPAKAVQATVRAEKLLPATGEATVQSKAGGTITIYNDYSAEPQTLVRNTRFETPTGLIFRIQSPVTVPGKTAAGPGSVEARVDADQVGESYNVGPIARFTIPGFSGKPQFDVFYAASSGSMSGGFDGVQKVADPTAVADAVDELTESLRGQIADKAASEAGEGYRAFTVPASFAVLATGREPSGDQVKVWVEAEADAFAVSSADFADAIAATVMPGYRAKGEARIDSPDALRVTPKEGSAPALEVTGQAEVTWTVDTGALRSAVLGQPIASFDQTISRFGGLERATPVVRPFWRSAFPTEPDSIDIEVEGDGDVDA